MSKRGRMNFDTKARDWDKDPKKVERAELFAGEILRVLGDSEVSTALEFGSGTGLASFQLKERFKSIVLADTSKGMLEVLAEKIKKGKLKSFKPLLIKEIDELLPYANTGVIFTLLTLHHVRNIDETFTVFGKILPKGGYLFIGDLVTEDGTFHSSDAEFDGHYGFDTAVLKGKLRTEGLQCIEDKIFHSIQREHLSGTKNYPLFFLAFKKI